VTAHWPGSSGRKGIEWHAPGGGEAPWALYGGAVGVFARFPISDRWGIEVGASLSRVELGNHGLANIGDNVGFGATRALNLSIGLSYSID